MKNLSKDLAHQFMEVQLRGKWVSTTNIKEALEDVDLAMATKQIADLNTIAKLTYHIHYYIKGINQVFAGKPLTIRDKFSFDMPDFSQDADWNNFKKETYDEAELFAHHVQNLTEQQLFMPFEKKEYGDYFRNITAMTSHSYYHLGQIVIIKKMIKSSSS